MFAVRLSLAVLLVAGAVSFSQAQCPCPCPTDLSGEWSGAWRSESSGHKGPLKASLRKTDGQTYQATFRGRFFVVLPFRYQVKLRVVGQEGDRVLLAGDSWLGRLFGTFEYTAWADARTFEARYTSKKDDGRFDLRR